MLRIRAEQQDRFQESAEAAFRGEMRAHLIAFHPPHARAAGDEGLDRLIASGLERVRSLGYRLRGSLRFFLEQMVLFGHRFDTDPLIPWGREFQQPFAGNELARADDIFLLADAYYVDVVGRDGEIERAAIRAFLGTPLEAWLAKDRSEEGVCRTLQEAYPVKCERAGADAVRQLAASGRQAAVAVGLPASSGGLVFAALALALGHGFATDPQYPWISAHLAETAGQPGEARVEKLAIRSMAFLSAVLAEHGEG